MEVIIMNEINKNDIPKKIFLILFYIFTMYILASIIAITLFLTLRHEFPNNPYNETLALTLTNLLAYATMTFTFLFILNKYYSDQMKKFKNRIFYYIGIAIIAWISSLFLTIFIEIVMQILNFTPRTSQNQEAIVDTFKFPLLTIPMIIFGAPIIEETIFRGVIFNFARNLKLPFKMNIILAFFLSATLFGAIHVLSSFLQTGDKTELLLGITYASAGLVLTILYYVTNNIFVPILMHMIQNTFSVIIIILLPLFPSQPPSKIVYILARLIHLI